MIKIFNIKSIITWDTDKDYLTVLKNKKIYIAGAGGMLGHAFYEHFKQNNHLECSDKDKNDHWLKELDFTFTNKYKSPG